MELTPFDIEKFDVEKYLDDKHILYQQEGEKNIAEGWIGVNCPFCPDGDPSQHLGINLYSKGINCWRCPAKGSITKYIMKIERKSFSQIISLVKTYANTLSLENLKNYDRTDAVLVRNLKHDFKLISELQTIHKRYLESRNLDAEYIYNKFKLNCIGPGERDWSNRLYIPVIQRGKILSYTTRATNKNPKLPYKNAPVEYSVQDIKELLYNYDTAKEIIIVTEGPGDVWNTGDGFVCTFGTKFTDYQVSLIRKHKKVFILFDKDAEIPATNLLHQINAITDVELLLLSEGDPGELSLEDVKSLRKMIFGKIY